MFTRCLVCTTPFSPNERLEHFPLGERVAYDPARGRLWAVCRSCKRWSLAPIEERWEALDELERIVRDRARLLSQTDNVALLRDGPLEIVRVGRADLSEEAWWRYGRELTGRRASYRRLSVVGSVAVGAVALGGWAAGGIGGFAAWFLWETMPDRVTDTARWLRWGSAAWRGRQVCPRCGTVLRDVQFKDRGQLILRPGRDGTSPIELAHRCPRCGEHDEGGLHLMGDDARRTLRRVLAYHHYSGASERRVVSATRLIQEAGSTENVSRLLVQREKHLGELGRTGAIALEIAANEQVEQRLLELELAQLEAHWRHEEELAAIVDGELTPVPLLESLRRRVTGQTD